MGYGFTLFGKPLLSAAAAFVVLLGIYELPEVWPDHAIAAEAILRDDLESLRHLIARGLDPNGRTQWRSYLRRSLGRASREGVGDDLPGLGAAPESLLAAALARCRTAAAVLLVEAGAHVAEVDARFGSDLQQAAVCDDAELVALMLEHGADPGAPSPDGGTVLWEPSPQGWTRRPYSPAVVLALELAGAGRPPESVDARQK